MGDGHSAEGPGRSDGELQPSLWRCSVLMTRQLLDTDVMTGSSYNTDDPLSV